MTDKCVIYVRVSSSSQATEGKTSLKDQEVACRKLAEKRGWEVVEVVPDKLTGTKRDRPGLMEVQRIVEAGAAQHVVVWDTSRFMRDLTLAQLVQAELQIAGAEIHFVEQPSTGNVIADAVMRTINYATDQIENDKRRARTQPKRLDALRAGRWSFPAPFGYHLIKKAEDPERYGELVVDETETETLRLIYQLYLDGRPGNAIADTLNRKKHPTRSGKPWNRNLIAGPIVDAEAYATGRRPASLYGENFVFRVEPLIDRVLAKRLQDKRAENTSHRGASTPKNSDHKYRGLVKCPCGRVWSSKKDKRNGRLFYRCPNRKDDRQEDCGRTVSQYDIDPHTWQVIYDNFIAEDASHAWIRLTGSELAANRDDIEADVAEAERLLQGIEDERMTLDEMLMKGQTTDKRHAKLSAGLDGEQVIVEDQLTDANARLTAAVDLDAWEEQAIGFVDRAWELEKTPEGRQVLVRTLVDCVLVSRDPNGERVVEVEWKVELPTVSTT